LSLAQATQAIRAHGGLPVPAHINRGSNGLLGNLGFLPSAPRFAALEVSPAAPAPTVDLQGHHILYATDAHRLEDMDAIENYVDARESNAAGLFAALARWDSQAR